MPGAEAAQDTTWQLRSLGLVAYEPTYAAMRDFTRARTETTPDELWLCEHPPVFTQGIAGRAEHVLGAGNIPVVQTDRGGQVTYHGPGQVVAYPLINLRRRGYFVKEYVFRLEEAALATLRVFGVTGHRVPGAPGVYVRLEDPFAHARLRLPDDPVQRWQGLGKIAALGIKLHRHDSYHGLSLNVAMDLGPFDRINPCGYAGLRAVDLASLGVVATVETVQTVLGEKLQAYLAA